MTSPAEAAGVPAPARIDDPLEQASATLDSIAELPLEQHPQAFARFDELLRVALESAPHVSSG